MPCPPPSATRLVLLSCCRLRRVYPPPRASEIPAFRTWPRVAGRLSSSIQKPQSQNGKRQDLAFSRSRASPAQWRVQLWMTIRPPRSAVSSLRIVLRAGPDVKLQRDHGISREKTRPTRASPRVSRTRTCVGLFFAKNNLPKNRADEQLNKTVLDPHVPPMIFKSIDPEIPSPSRRPDSSFSLFPTCRAGPRSRVARIPDVREMNDD